ncbi:MAG TPA: DUF192 domain-containing protein [Gaiellaceae bacterium]|nr:DUF192 domain-containing protein [Gaiellaceae bacterium]
MHVSLERHDGLPVCERCLLAETPFTRARGLLGRPGLERGEGILLRPASSIHMWFMRFPIDAAFLDGEGRVLKVVEHLAPWRLAGCRGAKAVLELPAGEAARAGLAVGDRLTITPAAREPAARAA